jgi:hypothetical protein
MDMIKSSIFSVWKEFETDPVFLSQAQFNFTKKVSISYDTLSYDESADFKVLVYCGEPDCVLNITQNVINNQNNFDLILSWKEDVLNTCKNSEKFLFGGKTITEDKLNLNKKNQITYLTSNKNFTEGHNFRQKIFNFFDEHDFDGDYEISIYKSPPRIDKEIIFNNAKFSIVVENGREKNYFSEKLIDCLSSKTIPIYWGCPNIFEYFPEGNIITFNSINELTDIISNLDKNYYEINYDMVEENYLLSKPYWNYYQRIQDKIKEYIGE